MPLILTSITLFFIGNISSQGAWCWIDSSLPGLRIATFYGWTVLTFIFNLVILIWTAIALGNNNNNKF
jgi:uncharacterized membrane protein